MIKNKIVLIPFPFDDLSGAKPRPALCLTEPIGQHRHLILAFITSRVPDDVLETDLIIDSGHESFAGTGLRVTSNDQAPSSRNTYHVVHSTRTGRIAFFNSN